jgi:hypothetical protein
MSTKKSTKLFIFAIFLSCLSYIIVGLDPTSRIFTDLMSGVAPTTFPFSFITTTEAYNSMIKPPTTKLTTADNHGALLIQIQMSLRQIVSLDEKNQILTTNIYLYLSWCDKRLTWNPANYSNVLLIQIPANKVWLPDLSIMNAAGTTNMIPIASNQYVAISYSGYISVAVNLPSLQTRCPLNVLKYPFDAQKCQIIIGSWMYTTNEINFALNDVLSSLNLKIKLPFYPYVDDSNYIKHPYWDLKSITYQFVFESSRYFQINAWSYSLGSNVTYQAKDLSFDLGLVRRPLYVMINLVYINFVLNIVILLAFHMPYPVQISVCKF